MDGVYSTNLREQNNTDIQEYVKHLESQGYSH
jgi:hypothetical protein